MATLSDAYLQEMIDRGALAAGMLMPRKILVQVCKQAESHLDRKLITAARIKRLLDDPHNVEFAALSIDTLNKLCRQAMKA